MVHVPRPYEIYRHFKGNLYQVITLAEHTETGEQMVVYQALYGEFAVYTRPLTSFVEKVDRVKYPDADQEWRFELQTGAACEKKSEEAAAEPAAAEALAAEATQAEAAAANEPELDPLMLSFLEAESHAERLSILTGLHHRITDEMITTMAIASDIEVPEGDLETRFQELKNCLQTLEKYECNRLR